MQETLVQPVAIPKRCLRLRSPTFLASGISFVKDSFSMDGAGGNGSGSNASNGEQQMTFRWLTHHSPPAAHPPHS